MKVLLCRSPTELIDTNAASPPIHAKRMQSSVVQVRVILPKPLSQDCI